MKYFDEDLKKKICEEYGSFSIDALGKKYGCDGRRIKKILIANGIEIHDSHKKTTSTDTYIEDNLKRFPTVDGKHYVAVSKFDGTEYEDYLNKSGTLIRHIKEHGITEIPSLFMRKKYFHENGKQWHEQWFEISLRDNIEKETKKCPYCNWETTDVENKSGMFLTHILKEHGITKDEHLKLHPEDRQYLALANPTLNRKMESDPSKYVTCAICGEKFARLDWRHLGKHGLTKEEYIMRFTGATISDALRGRLSEMMTQVNKTMSAVFISKPQQQIAEFIKSHGIECELSNRKVLGGKEIDIYIQSLKIGIEYNGNFWHTEGMNNKTPMSHLEKTVAANKKGVKLIQIFEDEYFLQKNIVYNKISHLLHIDEHLPKIMARKCKVSEVTKNVACEFLDSNHIQGYADSTLHLGAFYNDKLIAVMSFKRESKANKSGKWELTRFASDNNFICQGIGGKLFSYFVKTYHPMEVKSFADRRWTINEENNVYIKLGFKFDSYTKPNYRYYNQKVNRYKRFHKFGFRKQALHKRYGFPLSMTESEMTEKLGYSKIWDCGLIRYVWKNKQ